MTIVDPQLSLTTEHLTRAFLTEYPQKSARELETLPSQDVARLLQSQPIFVVKSLWKYFPVGTSDSIFEHFDPGFAADLISQLDSHAAVAMLSRVTESQRESVLGALKVKEPYLARELTELLRYPEDTAARMMITSIQAFHDHLNVQEALMQLRLRRGKKSSIPLEVLYLVNQDQQLIGEIELSRLILADPMEPLPAIAKPLKVTLNALDHKDLVLEKFEGYRTNAIPVLDSSQHIIGAIRSFDVYQSTKEDLVSDIQSMVGAGKEERALSSSWFAVRSRLPWLQINLLTAFAASAVVGAFEGLISQVTALAILLPVAAGQSGNAGAQALAVTMRGLTLREITTRHWLKVMLKEVLAGFINGIAIAVTCAIGVYVWSQSLGLAFVIGLAMITSLVIACSAGALVPIMLKRLGLDPAQSSSIVLTTVTDIAGFMSFLGIAYLLFDMLPHG
ncbi:magnesium transporter [Hahella sp. CCB-MM4]|uniref:magnesium transporter n=1 Tax=Hahella sp. (strain CCB-MM4) TaxID=1926491 RepID=UPI000B9AE919|nr:magnesium transporter [Hahella sp. CCB-MM4]OZG75020.1 magnesium transporter [Hahella sp. CCB-MM4]